MKVEAMSSMISTVRALDQKDNHPEGTGEQQPRSIEGNAIGGTADGEGPDCEMLLLGKRGLRAAHV